jgi:hypothetical protein
MTDYIVTVRQYNCFEIEADSEEEAKETVIYNCIWDESDSNYECEITVEKEEDFEDDL